MGGWQEQKGLLKEGEDILPRMHFIQQAQSLGLTLNARDAQRIAGEIERRTNSVNASTARVTPESNSGAAELRDARALTKSWELQPQPDARVRYASRPDCHGRPLSSQRVSRGRTRYDSPPTIKVGLTSRQTSGSRGSREQALVQAGGATLPKLIVLYPPPADVTMFERRYLSEHAPMVVQNVPGLKKFLAAQVLGTPAGAAPYQRVAELYFDSMESLQAAMASPGGQATVAHAMEISTGGPPVVLIAEDDKPI